MGRRLISKPNPNDPSSICDAIARLDKRLNTSASPTFESIGITGLTENALMYADGDGVLTSLAAATNGQLVIGSSGSAPSITGLTGTVNQVVVTNGAGSITLSTPQDIHTGATPTFKDLTLSDFSGGNESISRILNETINEGVLDVITVTADNGLGNAGLDISWTVGEVWDHANTAVVGTTAGNAQACTDDSINYLKWETGTGLTLDTDAPTHDQILISEIYTQDGVIWDLSNPNILSETVSETSHSLSEIFPSIVTSGMIVSENAGGDAFDIEITSGKYFLHGSEEHVVTSQAAPTMFRWFHDGSGNWDYDTNTQIDADYYDSGTGLVLIEGANLNKYWRSNFFVVGDDVHWIYPTTAYTTIAGAQAGACPAKPNGLEEFPRSTCLILKGSDAAFPASDSDNWIDVRPIIGSSTNGSISDHANLIGLAFASSGHTGFQAQGDILDDLNALGVVGADSEFLVGTAAGAFAWESGATVRTSLGVGLGDSPTITGLTLDNTGGTDSVLTMDGSSNDPAALTYESDNGLGIWSKDFQVTGGLTVDTDTLTVDAVTNTVGIKTAATTFPGLNIGSADGSDLIGIFHDNTDAKIQWTAGLLQFRTIETGAIGTVEFRGDNNRGNLVVLDEDNSEWINIFCTNGLGVIKTAGSNPQELRIQDTAHADVTLFKFPSEGETRNLTIGGFRTGDALRRLEIGVGVDAADTASFDGLSNYLFDGTIKSTNGALLGDGGTTNFTQVSATGGITQVGTANAVLNIDGGTLANITIDGNWTANGQTCANLGTVSAAASITSTAFVGPLTGEAATVATIAGLAPDTATTQATQANVTSCANLVTVGTIGTGTWEATDVGVPHGGTGKSAWTQYLIPYAATTTSFGEIGIGTDGQVLTSGGAGVAPSFEDATGGGGFVDRGDPAVHDMLIGDFTTDNTWRTIDLNALAGVPTDAKAVVLRLDVRDNVISSTLRFRKNGNVNNTANSIVETRIAGVSEYIDVIVALDSNAIIEYRADNVAFTQINLTVAGWWL